MFVYDSPTTAYEVEFVTTKGETIELLTVEPNCIVLE
ncbi:MAG: DUF4926 domain-containing protein [Oscillospiraceae bacterium]|nr:DUF4926 domain-containing protein [Oscillospiraceae bacterium]